MNRKLIGIFPALCLLTSCSSSDGGYSDYIQVVRVAFQQSTGNAKVTFKEAAAIPYASLGVRINGGGQQMIVLATKAPSGELWTNASHLVILTQDGRVTRTVGLSHDLTAMSADGGDTITPPAQALHASFTTRRLADFADIPAYNVTIACSAKVTSRQAIVILGKSIRTVRIDEQCSSTALKWTFTNSYWLDPDSGFVWRSLQNIHPHGETLQLEVLRPPEN
jgi:hypothetical protein